MDFSTRSRRGWLFLTLAPAFLAILAFGGPQQAAAGPMKIGTQTSQPIGHYDFCRRNRVECTVRPRNQSPLKLSDATLRVVTEVNLAVNREVKPLSDMEIYGQEEYWAYPDAGVGDCEDYVLEKRRRLARHGISLANLLITVVRRANGEGHAVLTVRTDRGDFVLDNLNNEIKHWRDTNYRFLKRQASYHTGRWVSVLGDHNLLVGSVNR